MWSAGRSQEIKHKPHRVGGIALLADLAGLAAAPPNAHFLYKVGSDRGPWKMEGGAVSHFAFKKRDGIMSTDDWKGVAIVAGVFFVFEMLDFDVVAKQVRKTVMRSTNGDGSNGNGDGTSWV